MLAGATASGVKAIYNTVADDYTLALPRGFRAGTGVPGVVFFHSRSTLHTGMVYYVEQFANIGFAAIASDLAGIETYGNDASIAQVQPAIDVLTNAGVAVGDVFACAQSMGGSTCLNFLRTNLTKFKAVALNAALTDVDNLHDDPTLGVLDDEIETAYTDLAGWEAAKATHNPIDFAADLSSVPMKYWGVTADPLIRWTQNATNFAAAHGDCPTVQITTASTHGEALAYSPRYEIGQFFSSNL